MTEWWRYENLEPCEEGKGWHDSSSQGDHPDDNLDFHLDLGCGKIPKARLGIDRNGNGDILMDLDTGVITGWKEGCELREEVSKIQYMGGAPDRFKSRYHLDAILPFPDNSIESIISHHFFEHLSPDGFINLIDDCYRVLVPGGILRIIVPFMPSMAAFESSDHKMLIGLETFTDYEGVDGADHWHESFATPYTKARFKVTAKDYTPPTIVEVINVPGVVQNTAQFRITLPDGKQIVTDRFTSDDMMPQSREMRVTLTK